MKRRVALALFTALALLAAPAAASALARTDASDAHSAASGHAVEHRHATVARVVGAARTGHDRRTPHQFGSSLAVLGGLVGTAPASTWARLIAASPSSAGELPSSARSRAPPAVV
jgi:hypothetical protein